MGATALRPVARTASRRIRSGERASDACRSECPRSSPPQVRGMIGFGQSIVQGNAVTTKAKILHDSHLSRELSGEPDVASVGCSSRKRNYGGQAGMTGHGGSLCTRRTVATVNKDPSDRGLKGKGMHHTTNKKLLEA